MKTLFNGLPDPLRISDGAHSFQIPPGTTTELHGTNAWTLTTTNAGPLTLPGSTESFSATVAVSDASNELALVQITSMDVSGMALTGISLVLGIGLPVMGLRWFSRLTSGRIED